MPPGPGASPEPEPGGPRRPAEASPPGPAHPPVARQPLAVATVPVVPAAIAALGLVLMIIGSFLPWAVSGQVRRSSYAISGVIDRLGIAGDGVLGTVVTLWPFFGPLCVLPVIAALLRWWRTAGVLGVVLGLAGGALSVGALVFAARQRPSASVSLDPLGPAVMAVGAVLLLVGALMLTFRRSNPPKT
jgi:hypothetical protein